MSRKAGGRAAWGLALALLAPAAVAAEGPSPVRELAYGEVLFHFYQRDYFTALSRLLAAERQGRLARQAREAELLRGGLSLSYGLHQEAERIFRRLLDAEADPAVHDRAWFFLGKLLYQRGYLPQAVQALERVSPEAAEQTRAETALLASLALMRQERPGPAARRLEGEDLPAPWSRYALYNRAVAEIQAGDAGRGEALLKALAEAEARDEETLALRDKANLALGTRRLAAGRHLEALDYFERVRAESAYSSRALLGAGWAAISAGRYGHAYARFDSLRARSLFDPAVQEAHLARPHTLARLGRYGQAAAAYEDAIADYRRELSRVDEAAASVRSGAFVEALLAQAGEPGLGWFRELERLPADQASAYLHELMAGHGFQEAYKNLHDLAYLQRNLRRWAESMDVFEDMLAARRAGYEASLPQVDRFLAGLDLDRLQARRNTLRARYDRIVASEDALGLASPAEQAQLARLREIGRRLGAVADGEATALAATKHRVLEGVLLWNLYQDYPARRWELEKALLELDDAIAEAKSRRAGLLQARRQARERFEGYAGRIAELRARIARLRGRNEALLRAHAEHLSHLAEAALIEHRARIEAYLRQARFALAQTYDRAALPPDPEAGR